jgi:hypothetical protein
LKNFITIIAFLITGFSYSQNGIPDNMSDRVMFLSYYIASDEFKIKFNSSGHKELVDTIFARSLSICDNDISEALLTATLATLPYKEIPVTIPIINERAKGTIFFMPDSSFRTKINNLPSALFFDSPSNWFGDKDKLSHFFGNAFLSYNVTLFNLSKFLSILVELFEESFKVDGFVSTRDLLIGNLGELFGRALIKDEHRLPSEYISLYDLFYINYTF